MVVGRVCPQRAVVVPVRTWIVLRRRAEDSPPYLGVVGSSGLAFCSHRLLITSEGMGCD